jgi:hypothetical protein
MRGPNHQCVIQDSRNSSSVGSDATHTLFYSASSSSQVDGARSSPGKGFGPDGGGRGGVVGFGSGGGCVGGCFGGAEDISGILLRRSRNRQSRGRLLREHCWPSSLARKGRRSVGLIIPIGANNPGSIYISIIQDITSHGLAEEADNSLLIASYLSNRQLGSLATRTPRSSEPLCDGVEPTLWLVAMNSGWKLHKREGPGIFQC